MIGNYYSMNKTKNKMAAKMNNL